MLQRRRVDNETIGKRFQTDRAHMREIDLLRLSKVGDQASRGADRGRVTVEAEPLEAVRAQLFEHPSVEESARAYGLLATPGSPSAGRALFAIVSCASYAESDFGPPSSGVASAAVVAGALAVFPLGTSAATSQTDVQAKPIRPRSTSQ